MDVHSKETRSFNMSRIRGKNTNTELKVRSICHPLGLRERPHKKVLTTVSDIAFKNITIIFVHGFCWRSHNCPQGLVKPRACAKFWQDKRDKAKVIDKKNTEILEVGGWKVMTIWGCALNNEKKLIAEIRMAFNFE